MIGSGNGQDEIRRPPAWALSFSASCPHVAGAGYLCMICQADATGHATVTGGPRDGRCLAILCPRHTAAPGWEEFKEALVNWALAGLIDLPSGGPGPSGEPEVWHLPAGGSGHWDPMPECPDLAEFEAAEARDDR